MTDFSNYSDDAVTEGSDFRPEPPGLVPGRVLQCDADFLAYHCGYRWEEESLEKSIETLKLEVETLRIMAGAEKIALHLTMGTKGGRHEIAMVKEYQGHREKSEGLAERVGALRDFMANYSTPTVRAEVSLEEEADDALCQAMVRARDEGCENESVLWSLDKDLWMVGGLHMDHKTYEITHYPWGYGSCHIDESTSSKKVVGQGTSFFWHQMLMGDGADGIPGLPKLSAKICMEMSPTKKLLAAQDRVARATGPEKTRFAKIALAKICDSTKPKLCGAVGAHTYLEGITNDQDAFKAVYRAYTEHYGKGSFEFECWRGDTHTLTAGDMLVEQARLLWMRREPNEDVMVFLNEVMK